jgi:atlastin
MAATHNHTHPHGQPVNVLVFDDSNQFQVNDGLLERIFLHPEVKNRSVVVFSIVGAFRQGKSFFLDYCLRFLYANVSCGWWFDM